MLSTVSTCPSTVPEFNPIYSEEKNFRKTSQQDFYSLKQNTTSFYDSNFEIANRAFYATINKFTCQTKRASYSFLDNWHLHNIYSKSQQTLLGIHPVRPAVLLSGDDFMFTPPFAQQEEQYEDYYYDYDDRFDDDEEEDWERPSPSEFYNLSPCPNSTQSGNFIYFQQEDDHDDEQTFYKRNNIFMAASYPSPTTPSTLFETSISKDTDKFPTFNDTHYLEQHDLSSQYKRLNHSSPVLSIYIPSSQQSIEVDPDSPDEPELSPCSSYEEQSGSDSSICSFSSSIFNQDEEDESSKKLQRLSRNSLSDDSSSIVSYQSLADLIHNESSVSSVVAPPSYGSTSNTTEIQSDSVVINVGTQANSKETPSSSIWSRIFIYLMCLWQMLVKFCFDGLGKTTSLVERQPLL
jgi:hypothetical protein